MDGLSLSASGLIPGTPMQSGVFSVGIGATNSLGTGTAMLAITIARPQLANLRLFRSRQENGPDRHTTCHR